MVDWGCFVSERAAARRKRRREMKRWLLAMVCVLALAGGVRAADEAAA